MIIDVCNEFELLTTYPFRKKLLFASQLENQSVISDGYVADSNQGYITVLQSIGLDPVFPNPITLLRPLVDYDLENKVCCIKSVRFRVYRAKLRSLPNSNVALTNAGYTTSGASPFTVPPNGTSGTVTNQFPQYSFEEVSEHWQPNYFRPQIVVNGMDILGSSVPSYFKPNTNQGDKSIGWELPVKEDLYTFFNKGIESIQVYGLVAQAIAPAFTTFERFFLKCELDIRWK
ncbi:MAG: hypothetical protein JNL36_07655 [Candidatus Kapabacteria bacterium]|nr:hypothetical protein [Candidatus Kapabacteria bacterium]